MRTEINKPDWAEKYQKLKAFVSGHADIRMTEKSLSVPKRYREEFYKQIDAIGAAFSREILGEQTEEAVHLASMCEEVRDSLIRRSNLKAFRLSASLENLLADPQTALAKPILGLLLDGLQQGLVEEELESRAAQIMAPYARDLMRNAYEAWCYYGIVNRLKPVRFYGIYSSDTVEVVPVETDEIRVGWQVTSPERRMPEAVFETEDGRTFAMKSEVGMEVSYYGMRITKKQDFSSGGNTMDQIAHRSLLLYQLADKDSAGLLADRGKLYIRPTDLTCEVLLPSEMEKPYLAAQFVQRVNMVRSKRPVQVLTLDERGEFPAGMLQDPGVAPIERRVIGYESGRLQKIAELLNAG